MMARLSRLGISSQGNGCLNKEHSETNTVYQNDYRADSLFWELALYIGSVKHTHLKAVQGQYTGSWYRIG